MTNSLPDWIKKSKPIKNSLKNPLTADDISGIMTLVVTQTGQRARHTGRLSQESQKDLLTKPCRGDRIGKHTKATSSDIWDEVLLSGVNG
jgi:phage/plasmid-associated DNA primase